LSEFSKAVDFKVFRSTVENGGKVKAIVVKGEADNFSRKDIDKLEAYVKTYGAKGLAWLKVKDGALNGLIAKVFNEDNQKELSETKNLKDRKLHQFVADNAKIIHASLRN